MTYHETGDDVRSEYEDSSTTRVPRWVKVVGIGVITLILLIVVVLMLVGGGDHGPSRHGLAGDGSYYQPAIVVTQSPPLRR